MDVAKGKFRPTGSPAYTTQEVAEKLKIDRNEVYLLIDAGALRAVRVGRKRWRILAEDLERFIAANANREQ